MRIKGGACLPENLESHPEKSLDGSFRTRESGIFRGPAGLSSQPLIDITTQQSTRVQAPIPIFGRRSLPRSPSAFQNGGTHGRGSTAWPQRAAEATAIARVISSPAALSPGELGSCSKGRNRQLRTPVLEPVLNVIQYRSSKQSACGAVIRRLVIDRDDALWGLLLSECRKGSKFSPPGVDAIALLQKPGA